MTLPFYKAKLAIVLLCIFGSCAQAVAQNVTVPEQLSSFIGAAACGRLGGTWSADKCSAPHVPYPGNACSVYNSLEDVASAQKSLFSEATRSCSAAAIENAKAQTLYARAQVRGYVTYGQDERVNDPVFNLAYRPNNATTHPGNLYFAAECAIRTCQGGGAPQSEHPPSNPVPAPEKRVPPTVPTPTYTPPPPVNEYFIFRVCNHNNKTIYVAVVARNNRSDPYTVRGWDVVQPGKCETIGTYVTGEFYFTAQEHDQNSMFNRVFTYSQAKNTRQFCIEDRSFKHLSSATCTAAKRTSFSGIDATGNFTWNVD
jgi:uncharacterized membrane protein